MKNENDVRLIDANKFLKWLDVGHLRNPSEICLSEINVKNMIDLQPTIDPESLPIVRELRREIDRLVNDGKQDLWAVERKRREEVEEELRREKNICDNLREKLNKLAKERYEAVNQLHGYCPSCKNYTANHMEGPCENCKHEYYMYRDVEAVDNWEWRDN